MASVNFYLDVPYKRKNEKNRATIDISDITYPYSVTKKTISKSEMNILLSKDQQKVDSARRYSKVFNNKETSINLIMYVGKIIKVCTKESIRAKDWDFRNRRARYNSPGSMELNIRLDGIRTKVLKEYRNAMEQSTKLTFDEIRELIRNTVNDTLPETKSTHFLTVYDLWLQEKKLLVKPLTLEKYNTLTITINDFIKHNPKFKNLCLHSINNEFDVAFRTYLIDVRKILNNTIDKYYDNMKSFMRWAFENGYHTTIDYLRFRTRRDDTDIIALSLEEVNRIRALNLSSNQILEQIRDIFIFQCFTGQRFSDIKNLKVKDIVDQNGELEWRLYQIKQNKSKVVLVPILPQAKEILMKYNTPEKTNEDFILPTASEAWTNTCIKQLCKMAGIDEFLTIIKYSGKNRVDLSGKKYEFISTHTSRRTFCTVSLDLNMPQESIMAITGHSTAKMLKRYTLVKHRFVKKEFLKAWGNIQ